MSGRFRVDIDWERCKGCNLCVTSCARKVLKMTSELNKTGHPLPRFAHPEDCTGCRMCADICPDGAIQIERLPETDDTPDDDGETEP